MHRNKLSLFKLYEEKSEHFAVKYLVDHYLIILKTELSSKANSS